MPAIDRPLVTVLTPVYNGQDYLAECIESVLAQTYGNWEYIVVNNHSTDRTLEIAEAYARKEPRMRVVSNDSLLPIIANHNRAFGLTSSAAKYCKVLSADDWLFPECLDRMVSVAEANPSVGLVGSYQLSGGGPDWRAWRVRWAELPYPSTVISGRDVCRMQMLGGPYVFGTPTSLLYRADLVRAQPEFYPNHTAEADTSACYASLRHSDFGFVHQVLSYERIHGKQMSEESRSLNSYESSALNDIVSYGSSFLTPDETSRRIDEILGKYYRFLAVSTLHSRNDAFWAYHKRRLADAGQPFSPFRLAKALLVKWLDLLFNPKASVEKLARRLAR